MSVHASATEFEEVVIVGMRVTGGRALRGPPGRGRARVCEKGRWRRRWTSVLSLSPSFFLFRILSVRLAAIGARALGAVTEL